MTGQQKTGIELDFHLKMSFDTGVTLWAHLLMQALFMAIWR